VNTCVVTVTRSEEWQSVHVVPVKVTEQNSAVIRLALKQGAETSEPSSRIEGQGRSGLAARGHGHT
jgi:hypothetical protein